MARLKIDHLHIKMVDGVPGYVRDNFRLAREEEARRFNIGNEIYALVYEQYDPIHDESRQHQQGTPGCE